GARRTGRHVRILAQRHRAGPASFASAPGAGETRGSTRRRGRGRPGRDGYGSWWRGVSAGGVVRTDSARCRARDPGCGTRSDAVLAGRAAGGSGAAVGVPAVIAAAERVAGQGAMPVAVPSRVRLSTAQGCVG